MKKEVKEELDKLLKDYKYKIIDDIDWHYISWHGELSENFIREFQNKLDWYEISFAQWFSDDFIREFQNKLDLDFILEIEKISQDFHNELTYIKPLSRYQILDFS